MSFEPSISQRMPLLNFTTMKQFVFIKGYTERRLVATDTIIRIEGASNYSRIYFTDGSTLVIAKTLKLFGYSLPDCFLRVHKSCLLNINFIAEIVDSCTVLLTNGLEIKLARRKACSLKKHFLSNAVSLVA